MGAWPVDPRRGSACPLGLLALLPSAVLMGCQVFHVEAPTLSTVLSLVELHMSYILFSTFASGWYTHCTSAPVLGPCWPVGII